MAKKKSDQSTIVKSIPISESGNSTTCKTKSGNEHLITNNPIKAKFTLWKVVADGYEKISVLDNPLDFDKLLITTSNEARYRLRNVEFVARIYQI